MDSSSFPRRTPWTGYAAAVAAPVALTLLAASLGLPPFAFEHLMLLAILAFAIVWGVRPGLVAAVVAVLADNVLLREPFGRPSITGIRDVLDLLLFVIVAWVVSALVTRARSDRARAELAAARERAAREERDRLIATVSHDLATPLSVLAGTVRFARQFDDQAQQELPRLLARLETATSRATSLVRMLSDAQALERHDLRLNATLVDLREVAQPVVEMMDRLSSRHPVVLAVPPEPVPVIADAERLAGVLENLLSNAIKYSPQGGRVEVHVRGADGQAVLTVQDEGIGISPEALPHIFERSYRAAEAAMAAPGLGLGLSIAAQIVAQHDGSLAARPGHPRGTVLELRLPLAGRPGAEMAGAPASAAALATASSQAGHEGRNPRGTPEQSSA